MLQTQRGKGGVIGLITFFLTYRLYGRRNGITPAMWGIKTNGKELVRTFCLAFAVFAVFYMLLFVLPYFNRYFFRITGKVYLGPMITCLIFIMMMLTSNVCYIPLE